MAHIRALFCVAVAVLLFACSAEQENREAPDRTSPTASEAPTLEIPLPICADPGDCELVGTISDPHSGGTIGYFFANPDFEDDVTRWGQRLSNIVGCADGGQSLSECVQASRFDQACRQAFMTELGPRRDPVVEAQAFERIFLLPGGLCYPAEGGGE